MSDDPMRQSRALEAMLNQERANALGLTGKRLEKELREMDRLAAELSLADGTTEKKLRSLHEDARHEAARQLYNLIVQREALGLTRHDDLYEQYQVPRSLVPNPR